MTYMINSKEVMMHFKAIMINVTKITQSSRPIPDSEIYEFVQKSVKDSTDYLYERDLHPLF